MNRYKIGFGKENITPNHAMQMGGYSGKRVSEGVHDNLFVKTIVLQDQETEELTVFASYDLIGIDSTIKIPIKEHNSNITNIILFATHTHSGPDVARISLTDDRTTTEQDKFKDYYKLLINQTIKAIDKSLVNLSDFRYSYNQGEINNAYSNRQDPDLYYNNKISVMRIDTSTSNALLYNFSCHPTILKPSNKLISKDLIWGINQYLDSDVPFFVNGTAGDISTRFFRISNDFDQIKITGKKVSRELSKLETVGEKTLKSFNVCSFEVDLKTKKPHDKDFLLKEISIIEGQLEHERDTLNDGEKRILETKIQGFQAELLNYNFLQNHKKIIINCNLIIWDDIILVTIPGELFSSLAKPLLTKFENVIFGTYSDGYLGYITDVTGYDLYYYESMSSFLERGQGEVLMEQIKIKIKENADAT